jgi:outer membrane lipoprotein-sorting protein
MRRPLYLAAAFMAAIVLSAGAAHAQSLDEIIATNLKSKGGLDKIRATTSVRMTGEITGKGMNGEDMKATMTTVAKRPNLMRREATVGGQRMVNAFDGKSLWRSAGTMPPEELPESQAAYAMQDAEFDSVFVDYKEKGHKIELVGRETLAGKPVYHLKVTKKGGPAQDYYLDAETGLEKQISTTTIDPRGTMVKSVIEFSDYRDVDGRMVPFAIQQRVNGNVMSSTTLGKVEFNVPVEDSVFRKPSTSK